MTARYQVQYQKHIADINTEFRFKRLAKCSGIPPHYCWVYVIHCIPRTMHTVHVSSRFGWLHVNWFCLWPSGFRAMMRSQLWSIWVNSTQKSTNFNTLGAEYSGQTRPIPQLLMPSAAMASITQNKQMLVFHQQETYVLMFREMNQHVKDSYDLNTTMQEPLHISWVTLYFTQQRTHKRTTRDRSCLAYCRYWPVACKWKMYEHS